MVEETKRIAEQPWTHIEETTEDYRKWLHIVQTREAIEQLTRLWKHTYLHNWYPDLIQYPVLKRLYEIARPHPLLYLHLQAVATHTAWATLDEVDGKYLIESFFFFPHHFLTLYERVLFLLYQGYPVHVVQQAGRDLLEQYPDDIKMHHLLQFLASQPATAQGDAPRELVDRLIQGRDELYQQAGLSFADTLEPK